MTWNYRLVKKKYPKAARQEAMVQIHEVYYDPDGNPDACTVDPVAVMGENVTECHEQYEMMNEAFSHPILNYEDIARKPRRPMRKASE